jgi:GT2 family glycosyltransferase/glycosyltransferase involved in cell wall biosynthesis
VSGPIASLLQFMHSGLSPLFASVASGCRKRFLRLIASIPPELHTFALRLWLPAAKREAMLKESLLASALFDPEYYLEQNPEVAAAGIDPAIHYIRFGGIEGRNPSAAFDASAYLSAYPDVRAAHVNPVLHYVKYGRNEGRTIRPTSRPAPRPKAPDLRAWEEIAARIGDRPQVKPEIDIIVPVYKGFDETASCLYAVLRSRLVGTLSCEIVVIDDRSPDFALSKLLRQLAELRFFTLLYNGKNLGFAGTVNRGIALHRDRDVILLNADTEVYGDWVERLHRAAYSEKRTGTVTPFSNNATICSYPYFAEDFRGSFEISFADIDRLVSEANPGRTLDIPTGVGFCLYIRRECIDEMGTFDAKAFGQGYGEENDFCQRIAARGWRNVLAADTFVRHLGGTSFINSPERVRQALKIVNDRYPHYGKDIDNYLRRDPLKPLRRNIDIARLRRAAGGRCVLFVVHNLGGGTLRYVLELARLLAKEGTGALLLSPCPGDDEVCDLSHPTVSSTAIRIVLKHDLLQTASLIRDLGVVLIHANHFFGFSRKAIHFIGELARMTNIPYDFTIHDYTSVCPRVNMIDGSGIYCDNRALAVCESCVSEHSSPFGDVSVWLWRLTYERFLEDARKIFVPDEDGKARLNTFFPSLKLTVRAHPEPVPERLEAPIERQPSETLRVAIIGAIGPHKGSLQVLRCAEDAAHRRLPIKFVLFGFTDNDKIRDLPTVEVTGRYAEEDLPPLLARGRCHLSFFPAVWPETYCYTLSHAFFAGLYPVAFDIGAIASRIRAAGWGRILPFKLIGDAHEINDALLACNVPQRPADWHPVGGESLYRSIVADYYELEE